MNESDDISQGESDDISQDESDDHEVEQEQFQPQDPTNIVPVEIAMSENDTFDFTTTCFILVGKEAQKVLVHECFICKSSNFFNSALKQEWDESRADQRTIVLAEEDPAIFEIYLRWVYLNGLTTSNLGIVHVGIFSFRILAECYTLGEILMDIRFKNAVMDAWVKLVPPYSCEKVRFKHQHILDFGASTHLIYEKTPEKSQGRRFLVEVWRIFAEKKDEWKNAIHESHPRFLEDLTEANLEGRSYRASFQIGDFRESGAFILR